MIKKSIATFLFWFLFAFSASSQTHANANTLLWRISGNGLSKPSYLYGTMHLQDRRLFHFTDSLYYHLEHTDGYAMEIDPNEMVDSVLTRLMTEKDTTTLLKNLLSTEEYQTFAKKLEEKLGMPADKITRKKIIEEQQKLIYKFKKKDDMPAAMDLYLLNIAKKQGKWTGGIEDVTDQLNLLDIWGNVKVSDLFLPDSKVKIMLEEMIKVYIEQDLMKLNNYYNLSQTSQQRSVLLLNRNAKMVRRIDSLARIRSTFFAIGAGHLPADSGVIDLLSRQGFMVTPIISAQKINPDNYKYTAIEIPWQTITEDKYNTYTVQMPGKPTDMNMADKAVYMKLYADLSTNAVFMTGTGPLPYKTNNLDSLAEQFAKNISKGGKITGKKKITRNGIDGYEVYTLSDVLSYRVNIFIINEIMYMTTIGCYKKEALNSTDAERFFKSFTINKDAKIDNSKVDLTWETLRNESKGFIAKCPVKLYEIPAENKSEENSNESLFSVLKYSALDAPNHLFYLLVIRDIKPGSYFHGDSVNAYNIKESLDTISTAPVKIEKKKLADINQYRLTGTYKESGEPYFISFTLNGNRSYTLFAIGQQHETPEMKNIAIAFMDSFELIKASPATWSTNKDVNSLFSTWVPSTLTSRQEEEIQKNNYEFSYLAYDKSTCNSFEIAAEKVNKYYWVPDDSTYFNEIIRNNYASYTDSILYLKLTPHSSLKSAECAIKNKQDDIVRKFKFILNGDRLFILSSYIKKSELTDENVQRFFGDFKFTKQEQATIFIPKNRLLFDALLSGDSATTEEAKQALDAIHFSRKDLPYLHRALFERYKEDAYNYSSIHRRIIRILEDISDSSTVDYIRANYSNGLNGKEELRLNVLDVLAAQKTGYAYAALKDLLFEFPITSGENYYLESSLKDSLLLSHTLYPEILTLAGDTVLWSMVCGLTAELLDSNFLSINDIKPFGNEFCNIASYKAAQLKKTSIDDDYNYFPLLQILKQLNTPDGNAALLKFTESKNVFVRFEAAMALLKNSQPVSNNTLLTLAANDECRVQLYTRLNELKKLNLFPVKYLSQKEISKSELISIGSEDDETPASITFIGERTAIYDGKTRRFLLYKITYDYGEEESVTYLGIAGPYDLKSNKITINADGSGIYYDESYNAAKFDKHLRAYLKKLEDYAKENKVQGDSPLN